MSDDPFQGPEWQQFADDVRTNLVPKLRQSGMVASLLPENGQVDAKIAVELGASILMDKPIVVVVRPGSRVPDHVVRVADRIIEADLDSEGGHERLAEALNQAMADLGVGG